MRLTTLDWLIVAASLVVSFAPALYMMRRAGSSTAEFFTSGRAAPWWLIGVSMVATTFSTDTPNLVTNLVREGGIAANWVWWAFLFTGMTTVFFYARLWRRLGVLTDLEFYELRYSGAPARWVRGFRAIYLGLVFNVVIMATVNLAAAKIANVLLGWPVWQTLVICSVINILFTGLLYLLRWYWWRINAWAEIAAMASSFLLALGLFIGQRRGFAPASHVALLATVSATTIVWMVTAFATAPTDIATLRRFYTIVRPAGPGWRRIRAESPEATAMDNLSSAAIGWCAGIALVYGALFGAGFALLSRPAAAAIASLIALIGGVVLVRVLPSVWRETGARAATL